MKSLTIFIIGILLLSCLVKSSTNEGEAAPNQAKSEDKSISSPKVSPKKSKNVVARKAEAQSNTADHNNLVCSKGEHLGNLSEGQRCRTQFHTKCKEIIRRDKNAPQTKTASERSSSLSTNPIIRQRQLKKQKRKSRKARRSRKKRKSKKQSKRQKKQKKLEKDAREFLNKMMQRKNDKLNKDNINNIAKGLAKDQTPVVNPKQKLDKLLKSREAKILKAKKKRQ